MNDVQVPVHGMPLEDRAKIKTGATIWTFVLIRPPMTGERRLPRDEGFGEESVPEDEESADQQLEKFDGSAEKARQPHRPTVPLIDETPPVSEGRRPTKFLEPTDSDNGLEPSAVDERPDEEFSHPRPQDKTKVLTDKPAAPVRDKRTKFF